ncbi:MAG: hypothetical protein ACJ8AW_03385 [Rhodopila sp.]
MSDQNPEPPRRPALRKPLPIPGPAPLPVPVPTDTRVLLAKLLGMLGSDRADVRASAALTAHQVISETGMTWLEVLSPPAIEKRAKVAAWRVISAECQKNVIAHPRRGTVNLLKKR